MFESFKGWLRRTSPTALQERLEEDREYVKRLLADAEPIKPMPAWIYDPEYRKRLEHAEERAAQFKALWSKAPMWARNKPRRVRLLREHLERMKSSGHPDAEHIAETLLKTRKAHYAIHKATGRWTRYDINLMGVRL